MQSGAIFSHWEVDSGTAAIADSTGQSTSVILTKGNAKIQAVFTVKGDTLTLQKTNASDTLVPFPTVVVKYGDSTRIQAKPARGAHFIDWTTVSGTALFADSMMATTTVKLTKGNATVRANTTADTFTLTLKNDSGAIAVLPSGKTAFLYGDTARLTATSVTGYRFSGWSGDTLITDSLQTSIKITFVQNRNITANFTKKGNYSLIISASGGRVTKSPDSSSYSYNDKVTLTAIPDSVHVFDHWGGDASGAANPCTVIVNGSKTVTANFAVKKFLLTMQSGGHGTTTPAVSDSIACGTPYQVSAVAGSGYRFINWTLSPANGGTIQNSTSASNASVTLTCAKDIVVQANFTQLYSVTYFGNATVVGGSVPVNPKTYASGDTVTVLANAGALSRPNYSFNGWNTAPAKWWLT